MKQTVERILEGQFDYKKGELDISVPKIEVSLCPDEIFRGSFTLSAFSDSVIEGSVSSDDIRLTVLTDTFSGNSVEISYEYFTRGLIPGDVCQGEIYIVSNQGEYYLPYAFSIRNNLLESSLGGIRNLFHFTNLAKSNWDEAVRMFYNDDFQNLFVGNDRQYRKTYLGFSRYFGNEQNVDSFLVEINKKNEIEYILDNGSISISDPENLQQETINITRNGWGYTSLNVRTDSDFIILSKLELSDNDFLGNFLSYSFQINTHALHKGNNYGTIVFFNAFSSITARITVSNHAYSKSEISSSVHYEQLNHELIMYYEAFRTRKITTEVWLYETDKIVAEMQELSESNPVPKLFKAQILITQERFNEANWLLNKVSEEMNESSEINPVMKAYYLYLTSLNARDEIYTDEITSQVQELFANNPSEWRIAWMLLYLCEEYAVSPSKKWLFIEEQINKQCASPMMYIEAANMLLVNAGLLTKLDEFEVKVVRYALQNDMINADIISQFVYLAGSLREYSGAVYEILKECFNRDPSKVILETIAKLLIKGDKKGPEYTIWYLSAIERELRITKLFEYYFESLDISEDVEIPKMVYLYFSYQTNLDYERCAYLYSKVISHKDEMPEVYASYSDRIREFAIDEIKKEHINKYLVNVYRHVLSYVPVTEDIAENLSRLLFMNRICIEDPKYTKALVYQSCENFETAYSIEDGVVYVPLYNRDYTIMFEDSFTNRYMKGVDYDLEKLMVPGKLATSILPFVRNNTEFDVYACECSSAMVDISEENLSRYQSIMNSPYIDNIYKNEIRDKLMQFYYDSDRVRELDELLANINPAYIGQKERAKAIYYMIIRGMYDNALEWILSYGREGVDIKDQVKLVSKLVHREEFKPNTHLIKLASLVFFDGKFDENILKYLSMNYEGMTRKLRKIFTKAREYLPETGAISERIILQTLYTGYFVPEKSKVYKQYVSEGADPDIQRAFITKNCFDFLVKDQITDAFVFEELEKFYVNGMPLDRACKLAYLKYHSDIKDDINDLSRRMTGEFIDEMIKDNLYLNIFGNYIERSNARANVFSDKTIIEYKTNPGMSVWIHYIIEAEDGDASEYVTEEMREMYGGIYAKPFTLFYGETLLYYITECDDGDEQLTESGSVQKSDISNGITNSRFSDINDIVAARSLRDYETVNDMIYESRRNDYIIAGAFKLQ